MNIKCKFSFPQIFKKWQNSIPQLAYAKVTIQYTTNKSLKLMHKNI